MYLIVILFTSAFVCAGLVVASVLSDGILPLIPAFNKWLETLPLMQGKS